MADQESKVKLLEDFPGYNGRIIYFGWCLVRVGRSLWTALEGDRRVGAAGPGGLTRGRALVRADSALSFAVKRRGEMGFLLFRWDDVVCDVLYEDSLALKSVSCWLPCSHAEV